MAARKWAPDGDASEEARTAKAKRLSDSMQEVAAERAVARGSGGSRRRHGRRSLESPREAKDLLKA